MEVGTEGPDDKKDGRGGGGSCFEFFSQPVACGDCAITVGLV